MSRSSIPLLGALLGALIGCADRTVVVGGLQEVSSFKAIPNPNLDLLFVIDDSGSMASKQLGLIDNFPRMMDVLAQLDGGLPDLHIGVVTSSMGTTGSGSPPGAPVPGCEISDDGALQSAAAPELSGTFISDLSDGAGGRVRNYSGELRDVFSKIATVGEQGCGIEQHLAAMRRALVNPANAGFVRDDANLAVIIIADEDDCSLRDAATFFGANSEDLNFRCVSSGVVCDPDDVTNPGPREHCAPRADSPLVDDVQPFIDALIAAKGDAREVMVAAIAGAPAPFELAQRTGPGPAGIQVAPSCAFEAPPGNPWVAFPAVRLHAFLDAFPGRSQLATICSGDLSGPLATIGDSCKKLVGDPCIDTAGLLDTSAELAGVQPSCEVVDIRDSRPDLPHSLPACDAGATDCFELVADATACPATADHLRVRLRRTVVADDAWTSVRCQR